MQAALADNSQEDFNTSKIKKRRVAGGMVSSGEDDDDFGFDNEKTLNKPRQSIAKTIS